MDTEQSKTPIIVYGAMTMIFGVLSALAILCWQIVGYLQGGDWITISVIDALRWKEVAWATNPESWLGLYEQLAKMPLSLTIILVSTAVFHLFTAFDK